MSTWQGTMSVGAAPVEWTGPGQADESARCWLPGHGSLALAEPSHVSPVRGHLPARVPGIFLDSAATVHDKAGAASSTLQPWPDDRRQAG